MTIERLLSEQIVEITLLSRCLAAETTEGTILKTLEQVRRCLAADKGRFVDFLKAGLQRDDIQFLETKFGNGDPVLQIGQNIGWFTKQKTPHGWGHYDLQSPPSRPREKRKDR